jgi:hypothetical protein
MVCPQSGQGRIVVIQGERLRTALSLSGMGMWAVISMTVR